MCRTSEVTVKNRLLAGYFQSVSPNPHKTVFYSTTPNGSAGRCLPHWGIENAPVLFPALIYFFYFSFKSVSFQFGGFIIFIVLYLLFFCSLRYFCREQRLFLSGWIFSSFIFSFPISTAFLLRPTFKIDFKGLP